jgi:membrane protein YqaA with SNARE-associated domain
MTDNAAPEPTPVDPDAPIDDSTRRFLLRNLLYLGIGVVVIVVVAALAQHLAGEQLERASRWLTQHGGYAGVFLSIWAIDTFTLPVSPDLILAFVAHEGSALSHPIALAVICAASVIAGNMGYYLARRIGAWRPVRRKLAKNYDKGRALFQRFGVWAVVVAGLTPVPFSIICWLAGIYNMPPIRLFFATFSRIPRFVGWYYLIRFGFSL